MCYTTIYLIIVMLYYFFFLVVQQFVKPLVATSPISTECLKKFLIERIKPT